MANDTRTNHFTLTDDVEPGHPAYGNPEWAADAAWGSLTNEYGLRATSIIQQLQHDGLSVLEIADVAAANEREFRTRHLGERPPLRSVPESPARSVLRLSSP